MYWKCKILIGTINIGNINVKLIIGTQDIQVCGPGMVDCVQSKVGK